jgi:hypothetical protein
MDVRRTGRYRLPDAAVDRFLAAPLLWVPHRMRNDGDCYRRGFRKRLRGLRQTQCPALATSGEGAP